MRFAEGIEYPPESHRMGLEAPRTGQDGVYIVLTVVSVLEGKKSTQISTEQCSSVL